MQAQLPFKWQRRLGPKRSAILDTCYNIAESPDPLSAFWNWTDIHIDLLLTDEVNFSRGSLTGHLSALEADGFIKRIHLRDYKRTNRGERFYTTPERVDEVNAAVREALDVLERFKRGRWPHNSQDFVDCLQHNLENPRFCNRMGL